MRFSLNGEHPLSKALVGRLDEFIDHIEDRGPGVVPIVEVTGAPSRAFAPVVLDISLVNKWERALRRLERVDAPVICLAEDVCGGTAAEILLVTDYRIAAAGFSFEVPATRDGVWPSMALYRLGHETGLAPLRRAFLFGEPIELGQALALSLVDEAVPDVEEALTVVLARLEGRPTFDIALRRQLTQDARLTSYDVALGRHLAACDRSLRRFERELNFNASAVL
jgi:isomerase DpgB